MDRRETGALGEKLARDFLKKRGYRIVETNYRCRRGEIDIVARQKDSLVFVEVRTKRNLSYGTPEESISSSKKSRMRNAAYHYLQSHHDPTESWRIDLVAVELDANGKPTRMEIVENAVWE
ncbi:MAG: YraN family protein [Chloroflexi bacterium RBG_16_57_8]|nr:MAG: YraN family protein [Chloroflexi bacterium RBG_16_57_8]